MTKSTVYTADVHIKLTLRHLQLVDSTLTLSHYFDVFRNNHVAQHERRKKKTFYHAHTHIYIYIVFFLAVTYYLD